MQSMNLTKLSAAIILALSTAACSSGGSHSTTSTSPVITEQTAAEKAAAEKAAAEKAAAEKAAAEKAAAEKAAAEKAEADRLAAEKAAAEKAAAEIEANRLVLLNNAKEAGLSDEQAAAYAETNKESDATTAQTALDTLIINIEKAEVAAAKGISDNTYPVGQITTRSTGTASSSINAYTKEISGSMLVYNQKYSVVLGNYTNTREYNNITGQTISNTSDLVLSTKGLKTTIDAIPTLGTATYNGKAFNGVNTNGILNYFVNFTDRLGSGSITGLGNTINLDQGSISGTGITSTAKQLTSTGTYSLDFYGKKAEEIAGKVIFNGKDTVGFGGTRSEISK